MEPQVDSKNKSALIPGIIAVAILVILVAGVMALQHKKQASNSAVTDSASQTSTATEQLAGNASPSASTSIYKNGTYAATGSYTSPGGDEKIDVSATLDNDTIKGISVTPHPASQTSTEYQGDFVRGYKSLVVGKKIDDVKLSKVSGSSLTSRGFNDALAQIREQAKI